MITVQRNNNTPHSLKYFILVIRSKCTIYKTAANTLLVIRELWWKSKRKQDIQVYRTGFKCATNVIRSFTKTYIHRSITNGLTMKRSYGMEYIYLWFCFNSTGVCSKPTAPVFSLSLVPGNTMICAQYYTGIGGALDRTGNNNIDG